MLSPYREELSRLEDIKPTPGSTLAGPVDLGEPVALVVGTALFLSTPGKVAAIVSRRRCGRLDLDKRVRNV